MLWTFNQTIAFLTYLAVWLAGAWLGWVLVGLAFDRAAKRWHDDI